MYKFLRKRGRIDAKTQGDIFESFLGVLTDIDIKERAIGSNRSYAKDFLIKIYDNVNIIDNVENPPKTKFLEIARSFMGAEKKKRNIIIAPDTSKETDTSEIKLDISADARNVIINAFHDRNVMYSNFKHENGNLIYGILDIKDVDKLMEILRYRQTYTKETKSYVVNEFYRKLNDRIKNLLRGDEVITSLQNAKNISNWYSTDIELLYKLVPTGQFKVYSRMDKNSGEVLWILEVNDEHGNFKYENVDVEELLNELSNDIQLSHWHVKMKIKEEKIKKVEKN